MLFEKKKSFCLNKNDFDEFIQDFEFAAQQLC